MSKKPEMGWIRGALRGQIQEKLAEARDAEENGDRTQAENLRRIAAQWDEVYENSRQEEK